jgi:RNA polymerase sigma-54 factor
MILQTQSQSLRPLTTAHLAQTMTLMSLTAAELQQKIEATLASNPALELVEKRYCPTCHRPLTGVEPCPICSRPQGATSGEPIVYVSPREDFYTPSGKSFSGEIPGEELAPEIQDLPTFVLRQIAPDLPPEDRSIAAHILTSLDEDGLLRIPLIEIARYHHVLTSRVESVQRLIQRAEPVGVGSISPQQALLVQLELLAETRWVPPLADRAIREGMDLLSRHLYIELGRLLGIPTTKAREIAAFVSDNLNPYPGRAHWGDIHSAAAPPQDTYHIPDIVINRLNDSPDSALVVEVISPMAGQLRINPLFRESLHQAPSDKAEEWQADLEQASLLVKCLQQRNHTMVRLMQRLTAIQRKFILYGDAHLEPCTRASLAEELEVHESTISRAVSGKAVQLPSGRIVPLSKLFDRSLHVRTALREIISQETKPFTDTQLAEMLNNQGYPVARRTVAKYRAMEGILPAHLRSQRYQRIMQPK